ncbi:MAG: hypothetical protein WDZ66_02860 [Steroidobacteraceae bacterium]
MENLLRIGQLKRHPPGAKEIERLLGAAQRGIVDARIKEVSAETRFDAAYRAIMQIGLAALMANGYRPETSRPGSHMMTIQALTLTLDLNAKRMVVIDTLRRKRNLADYTGEDVDDESVAACIKEAEQLLLRARQRIEKIKLE